MTQWAILYPVFVQVGLAFGLGLAMAVLRTRAERHEELADGTVFKEPEWSQSVTQVSKSFRNQFEIPILFYFFYLVVVLALLTHKVSGLLVMMALVFVLSGLAHAYVHVTSNDIPRRFMIYGLGLVVLILIWLTLMIRVIFEGGLSDATWWAGRGCNRGARGGFATA